MKFNFKNGKGETLSGRLELPDSEVSSFAVFAHCFTCSKDIIASNVIAKTLSKKGLAVLRFDFTGLGNSEGDFENTNFSSNVSDLLAAYKSLANKYQEPGLLIGHSLGGAAVLKAMSSIENLKAVVTLGAPSDVGHVAQLFEDDIKEIETIGQAEVNLVGRKFTIKKQFLDDINEVSVLESIRAYKKALLVMHSPIDNTVSIDHAANIFLTAKHPKSFITLDDADHLLGRRKDAEYAAELIAAWVQRYI